MHTDVVLTSVNYIEETYSSSIRFTVTLNGTALACFDTHVPGRFDGSDALEEVMRNRIHEIAELLDDWIRQGRQVVRAER
jgi:hypothetical protein